VVSVVNYQSFGCIGNQAVHSDLAASDASYGVECVGRFCGGPFVLAKLVVVVGVNDGEFALGKRYELCAFGQRGGKTGVKKLACPDEFITPVAGLNNESIGRFEVVAGKD